MRARTPSRLSFAFSLALAFGLACAGLSGPGLASGWAATREADGAEKLTEPATRSGTAPLPANAPAVPLADSPATVGTVAPVAAPPLTSSLPDVAGSVFRVLGAFATVMALFLGGVWAWRNWQRLAARSPRRQDLKVVEFKSLGARQTLWVIAYRKQRLLVASSPAGIALVSPLPEAEIEEPAESPAPDFAAAFRHVLGRGT